MENYNTNEELWKDVEGYEGKYQISNFGRVKSLSRPVARTSIKRNVYYQVVPERILKPTVGSVARTAYPAVKLMENNKGITVKVHRLVAYHFIENPNTHPDVNHKDEDKTNNHVSNLEWCSRRYNNDYGTRMERIDLHPKGRNKKPVKRICIKTGETKNYRSISEAARDGFNGSIISAVCKGNSKQHKGYKWEYIRTP